MSPRQNRVHAQDARIPLAWRNLTEDPWRLSASLAGAAFAVVLMFSQVGFRNALLENMVAVIEHLDGELFLINRERYMLTDPRRVPKSPARKGPRVRRRGLGEPLLRGRPRDHQVAEPDERPPRRIRVLAYPPKDDLLDPPRASGASSARAGTGDGALADVRSRPTSTGRSNGGTRSELRGRRVRIVGTVQPRDRLPEQRHARDERAQFPGLLPRSGGSAGATTRSSTSGSSGSGPAPTGARVQAAIRRSCPPTSSLLTKAELMAKERRFWEDVGADRRRLRHRRGDGIHRGDGDLLPGPLLRDHRPAGASSPRSRRWAIRRPSCTGDRRGGGRIWPCSVMRSAWSSACVLSPYLERERA